MRTKILLSLFFLPLLTMAQVSQDFNGTLNVFSSSGTGPSYTIQGFFNDERGYYASDSTAIGDIIYLSSGTTCARYEITNIISNTGSIIHVDVNDVGSVGSLSLGIGAVMRETASLDLPQTISGISATLQACVQSHLAFLVDDGSQGGIDDHLGTTDQALTANRGVDGQGNNLNIYNTNNTSISSQGLTGFGNMIISDDNAQLSHTLGTNNVGLSLDGGIGFGLNATNLPILFNSTLGEYHFNNLQLDNSIDTIAVFRNGNFFIREVSSLDGADGNGVYDGSGTVPFGTNTSVQGSWTISNPTLGRGRIKFEGNGDLEIGLSGFTQAFGKYEAFYDGITFGRYINVENNQMRFEHVDSIVFMTPNVIFNPGLIEDNTATQIMALDANNRVIYVDRDSFGGGGNTSIMTNNVNGKFTHDDGQGNTTDIDIFDREVISTNIDYTIPSAFAKQETYIMASSTSGVTVIGLPGATVDQIGRQITVAHSTESTNIVRVNSGINSIMTDALVTTDTVQLGEVKSYTCVESSITPATYFWKAHKEPFDCIDEGSVLYVSKSAGDNATAQRGRRCSPFNDPWAARDAAQPGDIIIVLDGHFTIGPIGGGTDVEYPMTSFMNSTQAMDASLTRDSLSYFFEIGTSITMTSSFFGFGIFADYTGFLTEVSGYGKFYANLNTGEQSHVIFLNHFNSKIIFEADEIGGGANLSIVVMLKFEQGIIDIGNLNSTSFGFEFGGETAGNTNAQFSLRAKNVKLEALTTNGTGDWLFWWFGGFANSQFDIQIDNMDVISDSFRYGFWWKDRTDANAFDNNVFNVKVNNVKQRFFSSPPYPFANMLDSTACSIHALVNYDVNMNGTSNNLFNFNFGNVDIHTNVLASLYNYTTSLDNNIVIHTDNAVIKDHSAFSFCGNTTATNTYDVYISGNYKCLNAPVITTNANFHTDITLSGRFETTQADTEAIFCNQSINDNHLILKNAVLVNDGIAPSIRGNGTSEIIIYDAFANSAISNVTELVLNTSVNANVK